MVRLEMQNAECGMQNVARKRRLRRPVSLAQPHSAFCIPHSALRQLLITAVLLLLMPMALRATDATAVADLLQEVKGVDADLQRSLLAGVVQGLLGVRATPPPPVWAELSPTLTTSSDARLRLTAQHLAALFGDAQAVAGLRAVLGDRAAPLNDRRRALRALLHVRADGVQAQLITLLDDAVLRPYLLSALAERDDAATPGAITAIYPSLSVTEKTDALNVLAGRTSYARALIAAVGAGTIPPRDLTASVLRQLGFLADAEVARFVAAQHAGPEHDALAEVARLTAVLTPAVRATGDRARGKAWFDRTCAQCHALWGGKGNLGPELTGLNRPDLDWVLKNVIDPSAIMGGEQQILVARLADGRVVAGMKREDASTHLALQNESGLFTLPKAEITMVEETRRSTMPDGLLRPFSTAELADLLAYLQGSGPLAAP